MSLIAAARRAWRAMPVPHGLRRIASPLAQRLHWLVEHAGRGRPWPEHRIAKGPLILSGFIGEVLGLGRAARLTIAGLEAAGFACQGHDVRTVLNAPPDPYGEFPFPAEGGNGGAWILHCNAPEAEMVLARLPGRRWRARYRIGIWAWELEALPEAWLRAARHFHEIWAPSEFVAAAIRPHARRVQVMPHPLTDLAGAKADRARFGMEKGAFVFAALADGRSTMARKNPRGAVEAFKRAFPSPGAARLVVKLVHADADPVGLAELRAAVADRSDISLYFDSLSDEEMQSFLASIDGLVSLHRSEGFGLSIAEAMTLGKPVVATGWSGNVDFMTGALEEVQVRYDLIATDDPAGRYHGARWADPDLDHAAALIRRIVEDQAFRAKLAEAGPREAARLNAPWTRERLMGQPFARFLTQ